MKMSAKSSMFDDSKFISLTYIIIFNQYIIVQKDMIIVQTCLKHNQQITRLCLAEECKEDLFLCQQCNNTPHKHSKTDIRQIKQVKQKLKQTWEPKKSILEPYFQKVRSFYESLRVDIKQLIDDDEKKVINFLTKVKYHHLPLQANSQAYLQFIREQYDRLDKESLLNLLNQAQNGELNKDLDKQKQISNFLDLQLKKISDKVRTLQYVMLSKKFKNQLLIPNLAESSKVADHQQFVKIYSFFNSRDLMIRSAKLIYRGSQYDFSPKSFYNRCNGVGNCMAIAKTKNGKLIGGFSPLPLVYHDEQQLTDKGLYAQDKTKRSFIFNITALKSYNLKDSRKALLYKKNWPGPSFGQDLDIGEEVTSNMGHSYEVEASVSIDSLQAKIHMFQSPKINIRDLQVWQLSF